jgi:hypothetical protein
MLFRIASVHAPLQLQRLLSGVGAGVPDQVAFRFPVSDSAFWPEGIAYDDVRHDFYVSDVRQGRVARIDSAGHVHALGRVAPAGWSALGIAFDRAEDRVWVGVAALPQAAGYTEADSGRGAIIALDRASGREVARYALPVAPEGHVPGDVLVTPEGDVYVSDSAQPVIWRVRGGVLEKFATDPGFRSLQGQALAPEGSTLYVADYSHGLAAIDLATRAVAWLPPPELRTTLGIDGLAWHEGGLVAVQNGMVPPRVIRIEVAGRGVATRLGRLRVLARNAEGADEPTLIAAVSPSALVYIANSQWEKYDGRGVRRPGTRLASPLGYLIGLQGECGTPDAPLRP